MNTHSREAIQTFNTENPSDLPKTHPGRWEMAKHQPPKSVLRQTPAAAPHNVEKLYEQGYKRAACGGFVRP